MTELVSSDSLFWAVRSHWLSMLTQILGVQGIWPMKLVCLPDNVWKPIWSIRNNKCLRGLYSKALQWNKSGFIIVVYFAICTWEPPRGTKIRFSAAVFHQYIVSQHQCPAGDSNGEYKGNFDFTVSSCPLNTFIVNKIPQKQVMNKKLSIVLIQIKSEKYWNKDNLHIILQLCCWFLCSFYLV